MGTGGTPALQSPKSENRVLNIDGQQVTQCAVCVYSTFYGQAERAISNSQLSMLPHLHICPIDVVVYHGPY